MQLTNGRQLLKFMHRGKKASRRMMRHKLRENLGYYDKYDSMYLIAGTLLGFGLGYLAAHYLRGTYLTEEGVEPESGEMTDWGGTTNPLHGDHDI